MWIYFFYVLYVFLEQYKILLSIIIDDIEMNFFCYILLKNKSCFEEEIFFIKHNNWKR